MLPACLTVICLADVQNQLLRSFTMRNCSPLCLGQESYEVTNDTRINQLLRSCTIRNRRQHYCDQEYCEKQKDYKKILNKIYQLFRLFTMRKCRPLCLGQDRYKMTNNTRFNQSLRMCTTGIEGLLWSRKNNITQIQKYKNINIKDTKLKANTKPPRIINR